MNYEMLVSNLKSIFTRDNVTFVLALMGAIGSFYTFIMQRKKIRITIQRFRYKESYIITDNLHPYVPEMPDAELSKAHFVYELGRISYRQGKYTRGKEL